MLVMFKHRQGALYQWQVNQFLLKLIAPSVFQTSRMRLISDYYGYVPTVTGGDGEKQDVYIVSDLINEPLQSFEGKLIAVVHRADNNEEKWVATTENETFSAAEIAARIHFMEQYFDSTVRLI